MSPSIEQPDVGNAVAQHRDALRAHAEGEAGVALGVDAAVLEHRRMHHAAAEDLHPAGALARGAAAPAAELARTSISADGSVNGKIRGAEAHLGARRAKNRRAKWSSVALRSTKVIPSSTASPSTCANTGACDASKVSLR